MPTWLKHLATLGLPALYRVGRDAYRRRRGKGTQQADTLERPLVHPPAVERARKERDRGTR